MARSVLSHIKINADLFIKLQLHNKEWVSCLALSEGRIEAQGDKSVGIIVLRQQEEFLYRLVLNLIIVCFTAESE